MNRANLVRHAGQQGQSLVLGMLMLGLLAIALPRFFSVGQVAAARARQTHALDAAAYSGALVQARALNMMAYINRSQVAHQVAMAHLVTLASWRNFGAAQAGRAARGNPPAFLIGMMFGAHHGLAYRSARRAVGMPGGTDLLAHAYARHDDIVHDLLAGAQQSVAESLPTMRRQAVREVLAANYPGHAADAFDLSFDDESADGYLSLRQPSGHADSMRDLVLQAAGAYGFLAPRDHDARNSWPVHPACPHMRHELRRRGDTRLDRQGRWQASDTQSFHALRFNRWRLCYHREYLSSI